MKWKCVRIMQSKVFAVAFSFLLLLTLSSLMFMPRAEANFIFPPANPEIRFLSPVNTTISSNNVSVKIEVDTYKTGYYGAPEEESLREFLYSLDEEGYFPFMITNSRIGRNPGNDVWFEGLIQLGELNEGLHNLTVKVVFNYSDLNYSGNTGEHYNYHTETISNADLVINSDNNLTHNTSETPDYLPIIVSVVVIAFVSSVSVFAYRKNRNLNT